MSKVALITGASRGIGAATAKKFAKEGYHVIINYNNSETAAKELYDEVAALGVEAMLVKANMAEESEIINLFKQIEEKFGRLDCLVNNAGICNESAKIIDLTYAQIENIFRINSFGAMICCREAMKLMQVQQSGSIINISSEITKFGGCNMSHYAASKAAIDTFSKALAREAAEFGIRVNVVSPAIINTDAHKDISNDRRNYLDNSIPMGRMGTTEEVANVVFWLASEGASYVSGSSVAVSGAR